MRQVGRGLFGNVHLIEYLSWNKPGSKYLGSGGELYSARGGLSLNITRVEGSGIGYLEARRIRDLLVQSNPDSRNFFGRLSGIAVSGLFQSLWIMRSSIFKGIFGWNMLEGATLIRAFCSVPHSWYSSLESAWSDVINDRVSGMPLYGLMRRSS